MRLFGGFRVERTDGGRAVSDWHRRSAKTLTKLIAVHPGHAMHREQIIDTLWPDVDAESALNSFGKALHAARHALEPELPPRQSSAYLRLADAVLILDADHVVVDADQFELLAEDALRRRAVEAYQDALAAYRGELLPEDRYEDWCSERRGVLAGLRIRLLLGMAEVLERRGAYNDAATALRDVLRQEPTHEVVHQRLMRLYARMGTPDQAVRQFHLCEEALRRELDLALAPETVSLYEEILAHRLSPHTPQPAGDRDDLHRLPPTPTQAANGDPFVGRERMIQVMWTQLARREEGKAGMIVVGGEAGVGKTRLLEEFASQARKRGAVTLCGGRGSHASQFACGPFAVALEDYAASRPAAERAELARTYPALARFVPSLAVGSPPRVTVPDLCDYHLDLIPSVVKFLTDLACANPVVLVLGDLDEADPIGLDLIRYLAHLAVRLPMLVAGALRDSDIEAGARLPRMVEAMTRERLWRRIDLRCLSRHVTDQLVHAMLPGVHVSDESLAEIYAQSRGNPLFVRELVHGMNGDGDPNPRAQALTEMRLALMDESLRRVLGLVAAAGATGVSLSRLCAGAVALEPPLFVPALFDALDHALRMRLLEERNECYAFRHPFVRLALHDYLPRHRREEFRAALQI